VVGRVADGGRDISHGLIETGAAVRGWVWREGMSGEIRPSLSWEAEMAQEQNAVLMPSEVSTRVGFFDRFAGAAAMVASRAVFFAFCVVLIVVWAPSILLLRSVDTWQLIINTATTIITFLMVALLQNSQTRSDQAVQHKLNALADGLADVMAFLAKGGDDSDLENDLKELRAAVGLEEYESTSDNSSDESSDESNAESNDQRRRDRSAVGS
jgi:hypothetical protein